MMWRSKKTSAEGEEENGRTKLEEGGHDTTTVETEASAAEAKETRPSFIKSLFKRKSYKEEKKDEVSGEKEVSETREQSEQEDAKEDTDTGEEVVASMKARWANLWGPKNAEEEEASPEDAEVEEVIEAATASQEGEAIEVEVTADSSLQIHEKPPIVSRSSSKYDPTRPTVHEEALEMLTGSLLIYLFADVREMAREGIIDAPEIVEDPNTIREVLTAIQKHKEALEERAVDHEDMQERLTALKDAHAQISQGDDSNGPTTLIGQVLQGGASAVIAALKAQESLPDSKESVLAQFHDETSTQGVVYGIAVNHLRKRVTVIFRGSVTQQDFLTDARSAQKKVDNPVLSLVDQASWRQFKAEETPKHIQIHTGFYTYLFAKDKDNEEMFRWERILEDAKALLKENPGYRLYITGHSLGGALATLCGFYAALDDELIKNGPVVIISIASPQVGHVTFCESFHVLEKLGRLQHLRVANKEDMITHLPFLHIKAHFLSPVFSAMYGAGNLYKHCGIHLELKSVEEESKKKTEHFVCHPKSRCPEKETISEEFKRAIDAAKLLYEAVVPLGRGDFDALTGFHSCKEYEARLMASQEYLESVTLDQLYQDECIVGAALAKSLSEQVLPEA